MAQYGTDSSGQHYAEINLSSGEVVRITHVPVGSSGHENIRIQIRATSGHLRHNTDIPLENFGEVMQAMVELIKR